MFWSQFVLLRDLMLKSGNEFALPMFFPFEFPFLLLTMKKVFVRKWILSI